MIQLGSAYGEIQIGTGDAERNVASLASSMRRVGQTMSLALTAPLLAVGGAGLKATAGFEQSMNQISVIADATTGQMQQMQNVALALGRDTSFSAGQAAEGMLELAKAGLSAEQTMDAIGGVLDLAAAGNLSVARAAEISANALNAFSLPATDAGKVANLLAAAANASSVEVTDMAAAFQMSSAVFASNQQSIEDLSTAIAILGDNGLKGSDSGTSLKTMLMRLTAPTKDSAKAMAALGLQVYNADGSMRSFQDIVAQLETATAGLTAEQRNQALTTIFGADAIRAANILIKEGAAEFDAMKESVNEAGAAQKVAEARMKGLAGAVAYAKGTIESTLISAFLPLTESLGNLIRQGADVIGKFASLPEPIRNAALAFGAVLAVAGPLLVALPMIGAVLAALLSPIGLIAIAVAGLAAAWAADFGGIREKTAKAWAGIQPTIEALRTWLGTNIPTAITTLQTVWGTAWTAIQAAWTTAWTALSGGWSTLRTWLGTNIPTAITTLQTAWGTAWTAIQAAWTTAWTALSDGWATLRTWLGTNIPTAITTLQTAWGTAWTAIQAVVSRLIEFFTPAMTRIQEALAETGTKLGPLGEKFATLWAAAEPVVTALVEALSVVLVVALDVLLNAFAAIMPAIVDIVGVMVDQLTAFFTTITRLWEGAVDLFTALMNGDWAGAWTAAQGIVQTFADYWQTTLDNMLEVGETIIAAIWETITNTLRDLGVDVDSYLRDLKTTWETIWGQIQSRTIAIVGVITGTFNSIAEFATTTIPNAFASFKTWLGSFSIPNPFSALAGTIGAIKSGVDGLRGAIQGFVDWIGSIKIPNPFSGFSLPSIPGIGANAMGTDFWRGGLTLVGERGPELVELPRGSRVYTAQQTAGMLSGATTIENHYHIADSLDLESVAYRLAHLLQRRMR